MKKSILALSLLGAFSGAAFAQSSVTIYGVADVGVQGTSTGSSKTAKVTSGQEGGSRLGFKGTEDLGGGLKANFVLEQGVLMDTGASDQGGRTFGRTTLVGLSGDFGSINIGRDKTTTLKFFDKYDPFGSALVNNGNGTRALYFVAGKTAQDTNGRVSNAIFYNTTDLSGFTANVSYAAGEKAGDNSGERSVGLTVNYKVDALEVGYNYAKDNAAVAFNPSAHTLAAAYDFGVAKPVVIYQKQKADNGTDRKAFTLAVSVPVTATGKVLAGFTKVNESGDKGAKQFNIGYVHGLSKRTDLYTAYAYSTQESKSNIVGTQFGGVNGQKVNELTAGIQHRF
ncbi:porin [Undibacterium squillarum]|uniref:Porin n=1 Tax=Undibacterium squillarum TaxID=1131567 RepID=A0ABQ2Y019_9BURK|nr:porin [Undibacterium squillarum]GGX46109.1 porin [Undibacterium squillarum]